MNLYPHDDYHSLRASERRERQAKARRAGDLMKAIDLDRSSFRCITCGEWFGMNFKAASGHICTKCDE